MDARWLRQKYVVEGLSARALARLCGCCKATVIKRLRQHNIPLRPVGARRTRLTKGLLLDLYVKKGFSARRIALKVGCGATSVFRHLEKHGIKARDASTAHMRYPRKPFSGDLVDKAHLMGFSIGDLRVRKIGDASRTVFVDCGSTKQAQIALIRSLFDGYGRVWVSNPSDTGKVHIQASLDESFSFLLAARRDLEMFLEDSEAFFPFLAGFSDAEGCFGVTRHRAYYSLGNYDKSLLELIRQKLLERGIPLPVVYTDNKLYISSDGYRRNGYYSHLAVHRKEALAKLIRCLEPFTRHKDKKRRMRLAKQNLMERGL